MLNIYYLIFRTLRKKSVVASTNTFRRKGFVNATNIVISVTQSDADNYNTYFTKI